MTSHRLIGQRPAIHAFAFVASGAFALAGCGGDDPSSERSPAARGAAGVPGKTSAAEAELDPALASWSDRIAIVVSPTADEARRGESIELVLRTLNVSGAPVSLERMNCSWFEDWRVVGDVVPAFQWDCDFDVPVVDAIRRDGFVEQRVSWSVDERWPLGEARIVLERMTPDGSVVTAPAISIRIGEPDPERIVGDAEEFILRTIRALPAPAAFERLRERARIDADRALLRELLEESLADAERADDRARAVAILTVLSELGDG